MAENFLTLTDLLRQQPTPPEWTVPNLFQRGRLTTLYAPSGMGKSTLYWEAVAAFTAGRDFLGLYPFTGEQGFLVCDWENPQQDVSNMLRRLGAKDRGNCFHYMERPAPHPLGRTVRAPKP